MWRSQSFERLDAWHPGKYLKSLGKKSGFIKLWGLHNFDLIRLRELAMTLFWKSWDGGDMLTFHDAYSIFNFTNTFSWYNLVLSTQGTHEVTWSFLPATHLSSWGLPCAEVSRERDQSCFQMLVATVSFFWDRVFFWGLACHPGHSCPSW